MCANLNNRKDKKEKEEFSDSYKKNKIASLFMKSKVLEKIFKPNKNLSSLESGTIKRNDDIQKGMGKC